MGEGLRDRAQRRDRERVVQPRFKKCEEDIPPREADGLAQLPDNGVRGRLVAALRVARRSGDAPRVRSAVRIRLVSGVTDNQGDPCQLII